MKQVEIDLDEEKQKEIIKKLLKQKKNAIFRKAVTILLLLVFSITLINTFSKIGKMYNSEFLFGQLSTIIIFIIGFLFEKHLENLFNEELEKIILSDKEINKIIQEEIKKYEGDDCNE